MNYSNDPHPNYHKMVRRLEKQGLTTSDAQGAADAHYARKNVKHKALQRFHTKGTKYLPVHPIHKGEKKQE